MYDLVQEGFIPGFDRDEIGWFVIRVATFEFHRKSKFPIGNN